MLTLSLIGCGGGGGGGDDDDAPDAAVDVDAGEEADAATPDAAAGQPPLIEGLATLAGTGVPGSTDGDREHARFHNPVNLVVAPDGSLIVADFDNSLIRRVTTAGDVSTISLPPAEGVFARPFGLALSGEWLYIQTDGNSLGHTSGAGAALWRMPWAGGAPQLVRDTFGRSRGIVSLGDGRLAASFYQEHVVQAYDPASNMFAPLAGLLATPGDQNGQGDSAWFDQPYDLLVMEDGSLLVADLGNHRLRLVDMDGRVTSYAGNGQAGTSDGPLASATFSAPQGLARDEDGNIYVTDTDSYLVRRISPAGYVTTIAGSGEPGYGDSEEPRGGQLYGLEGLDVSADGYLYISDGSRGDEVPYHRGMARAVLRPTEVRCVP